MNNKLNRYLEAGCDIDQIKFISSVESPARGELQIYVRANRGIPIVQSLFDVEFPSVPTSETLVPLVMQMLNVPKDRWVSTSPKEFVEIEEDDGEWPTKFQEFKMKVEA